MSGAWTTIIRLFIGDITRRNQQESTIWPIWMGSGHVRITPAH